MINITIDPLLIPILTLVIVELFRIENRVSRLEQEVSDFMYGVNQHHED